MNTPIELVLVRIQLDPSFRALAGALGAWRDGDARKGRIARAPATSKQSVASPCEEHSHRARVTGGGSWPARLTEGVGFEPKVPPNGGQRLSRPPCSGSEPVVEPSHITGGKDPGERKRSLPSQPLTGSAPKRSSCWETPRRADASASPVSCGCGCLATPAPRCPPPLPARRPGRDCPDPAFPGCWRRASSRSWG
jgi:hypothetical protein